MEAFRSSRIFPTIMMIVLMAFLTWSCGGQVRFNYEVPPKEEVRDFTGEELFKGIIFAQGQVTEYIPELKRVQYVTGMKNYNEKQKAIIENLQSYLLTNIKESNPEFLAEFKENVQSGNPLKVQEAIDRAGIIIAQTLSKENRALKPVLSDSVGTKLQQKVVKDETLQKFKDLGLLEHEMLAELIEKYQSKDLGIARVLDIERDRLVHSNVDLIVDLQIDKTRLIDLAKQRDLDVEQARIKYSDISRYYDMDYNPVGDVAVDVETVAYAAVAVVVAAVAVAVVVVGAQPHPGLKDPGGIFHEQMVRSISTRLQV